MPSKISYGSLTNNRPILIGHYQENPLEVLKIVLPEHRIYRYGDVELPVDFKYDDEQFEQFGLIIEPIKRRSKNGLNRLSDLDLSTTNTNQMVNRDYRYMRAAFRKAVNVSLKEEIGYFGTLESYLLTYEQENEMDFPVDKNKINNLLDITNVAFRILNPSINDLKKMLGY